jgi:tetratricopeptide (TPR) repeat protein
LLISLPAFIVCLSLAVFSIKMTAHHEPGGFSAYYYAITQPFVMVHYFLTFFLPLSLSADTDWGTLRYIYDDRFLVGMVFIILMIYFAFKASVKKETKPVAFGIIWFFLALLPTSSFIPLAEVMNDHRIFFPYVGLMLGVCWYFGLMVYRHEDLLKKNAFSRTLVIAVPVLILAGNAYGTFQRNKVWRTEESLWFDVTVKSPQNGRGLMNYGLTQMSKGNYEAAKSYFEKALIYNPYYSYLHINLGILNSAMGKPEEAENYFKKGLEYGPNDNTAYYYYAKFMKEHFRGVDAIEMLKKAIAINPASLDALYLLMELYADFYMWDNLAETARQTLRYVPNDNLAIRYLQAAEKKEDKVTVQEKLALSNPTPENYLNLSLLYYQAGKFEKCIEACNKALKIKPDYADAYNNICSSYNAMGKWDEAIRNCNMALKFKPDYQLAKNNLNWAIKQKEKTNQ